MQFVENKQKEEIVYLLRKHGIRITWQRLAILDVIVEQPYFSCKQVYYQVIKQIPDMGRATVYRTLNMLESLNVIEHGNLYRWKEEKALTDKASIDYHEILECITCALDAKDAYTAGHSKRVSDMAMKVCHWLHLDEKETERIHIAAHLHDIGKIGVPDAVLNKNGRLSEEEWKEMKKHPAIGAAILSKSRYLAELQNIVLHHHERYDGKGYPTGLAEEEISLGARIVAICDSVDAITSTRSYRLAHNFDYCYREIEKNLGKMYDEAIGRCVLQHWDELVAFLKCVREADEGVS